MQALPPLCLFTDNELITASLAGWRVEGDILVFSRTGKALRFVYSFSVNLTDSNSLF